MLLLENLLLLLYAQACLLFLEFLLGKARLCFALLVFSLLFLVHFLLLRAADGLRLTLVSEILFEALSDVFPYRRLLALLYFLLTAHEDAIVGSVGKF